ncbi:hypothetical protein SAMN02799622_01338 [Methylobacterium sp. UNC378MF]|uniref:hypothetical protein n=1 Tax=Methylobacterium sp. UNC378MF TaxID=1502748 RepID=UPI000888A14D|nr:hypothetical protein [Methylobacterium sp. UNC378MF]SDA15582.1 hypothetical protein SAMN02799622_01338 [Methylobacterium sp. UNC378MF]
MSRLSAQPPPPKDEKPKGRIGHAVPKRDEAPQNMAAADGKLWFDMSFKVTREQLEAFRLKAAKRKMKQKDLLLARWAFYCNNFPVPDV